MPVTDCVPTFSPVVLKQLMFEHALTETALSISTGIPQPTIHRLVSEKTPNPRILTLAKIAQHFQVSLDQLLGYQPLPTTVNGYPEVRSVPILQWSDLPDTLSQLPHLMRAHWPHWTHVDVPCSHNTFALPSKAALTPIVPHGALLSIDPDKSPKDGDIALVLYKKTQSASLRRIYLDGDIQELQSLDTSRKAQAYTDDISTLGTLIQTKFTYSPPQ